MNLRSWLRRQPQPSSLRCDGRAVQMPPTTATNRWAEILNTLELMAPKKVEAIDENGAVLRVCQLDADLEADGAEEGAIPKTERMAEMVLIARELRLMSESATRAAQDSNRYAFETLASICSSVTTQLAALQTAYSNLIVAHAEARAEAVANNEEANALDILGNVMGGNNGKKANGKAEKKEEVKS